MFNGKFILLLVFAEKNLALKIFNDAIQIYYVWDNQIVASLEILTNIIWFWG